MGGSGVGSKDFGRPSSGGGGGGIGGGPGPNPCVSFNVITVLASPVPAVISTLNLNDRLMVSLSAGGAIPIMVQDSRGNIAGSIAAPGLAQLVACLRNGEPFVATVVGINGGAVSVEVSWGSP